MMGVFGGLLLVSVCGAAELQYLPEVKEVRLSPKIREEKHSSSKYIIQTSKLSNYLADIVFFEEDKDYNSLPYVLGYAGGYLLGSVGDVVFTQGLEPNNKLSTYNFIISGNDYYDPETEEFLGFEANVIGAGEINKKTVPASLVITKAIEPIEPGVRFIPRTGLDLPEQMEAQVPDFDLKGFILGVRKGIWDMGKDNIVILSLGKRNGLKQGHLLQIVEAGQVLEDPFDDKKIVALPNQKFGEILVYKVLEKLSLGIIIEAERAVLVDDLVVARVDS